MLGKSQDNRSKMSYIELGKGSSGKLQKILLDFPRMKAIWMLLNTLG